MKESELLIIDFSQLVFTSYYTAVGKPKEYLKFLVLNMIRKLNVQFKPEEIILATDYKSWRTLLYPLYKYKRKQSVKLPEEFFNTYNELKNDIKENFPYKVLQVKRAEGDDVIAVLSKYINKNKIIVSSDKDLVQLLDKNTRIYNPFKSEFTHCDNIDLQMIELIVRGDSGDGIPNVLMPLDCFAKGERQKPIRETKILEIFNTSDPAIQIRLEQNKALIKLTDNAIPKTIQKRIIKQYESSVPVYDKSNILTYLSKNTMQSMYGKVDEFCVINHEYKAMPEIHLTTSFADDLF